MRETGTLNTADGGVGRSSIADQCRMSIVAKRSLSALGVCFRQRVGDSAYHAWRGPETQKIVDFGRETIEMPSSHGVSELNDQSARFVSGSRDTAEKPPFGRIDRFDDRSQRRQNRCTARFGRPTCERSFQQPKIAPMLDFERYFAKSMTRKNGQAGDCLKISITLWPKSCGFHHAAAIRPSSRSCCATFAFTSRRSSA